MDRKDGQLGYYLLGIALASFVVAWLMTTLQPSGKLFAKRVAKIENKLILADNLFDSKMSILDGSEELSNGNLLTLKRDLPKGFELLHYQGGELACWTTRNGPNTAVLSGLEQGPVRFLTFSGRTYQVSTAVINDSTKVVGVLPIFDGIQRENKLIPLGFKVSPKIVGEYSQEQLPGQENLPILNSEQEVIGYINESPGQVFISPWVSLFWLTAMLLSLLGVFLLYFNDVFDKLPIHPFIYLFALTYLWRFAFLKLDLGVLSQYRIFDPEIYANSVLSPSLGALFLTSLLIFFLVQAWLSKPMLYEGMPKSSTTKRLRAIYLLFLFCLGGFIMTMIFQSILLDSQIELAVGKLQSMNGFSVLGLSCILLSMIIYFYFSYRLVRRLRRLRLSDMELFILFALAIGLNFVLIQLILKYDYSWFLPIWLLSYGAVFYYFLRKRLVLTTFLQTMTMVALFSINAAFYYNIHEQDSIADTVRGIADELYSDSNPLARIMLESAVEDIQRDNKIVNDLKNPFITESAILERVKRRYLGQYLRTFDQELNFETVKDSTQYSANLRNVSSPDKIVYQAEIPLITDSTVFRTLSIELTNSKLEEVNEFLRRYSGNEEILREELPRSLSYALLRRGEVYHSYGNLGSFTIPNFIENLNEGDFETAKERDHVKYYYKASDKDLLILRIERKKQFSGIINLFSYNFSLITLVWLLVIFFSTSLFTKLNPFFSTSLMNRLQYILLMLLFTVVGITAIVAFVFFQKDIEQKAVEQERNRVRNLITSYQEFNNKRLEPLDFNVYLNNNSALLENDVFFYDNEGKLTFSSDNTLLEDNTWSKAIDPIALQAIKDSDMSFYSQSEVIGDYNFIGAYTAFKGQDLELDGVIYQPILNIRSAIKSELRSIYITLLKVFTFIMLITTLATLFVTRAFTGFLFNLRNKLLETKLGGEPMLIEWKYDDEIGQLVDEYNTMVNALEEGAILLARNERESAWREMAKQVAHEIKNPLTPMKLSIQQLQRSMKDENGDSSIETQASKTLKTLVTQIDHLSRIASDFSDMAKMPLPVNEEMSLKSAIEDVMAIFQSSTYDLRFQNTVEGEAKIYADPTMISRVLNNVVKNASQSLTEGRPGVVIVSLVEDEEEDYIVKIQDNGKGIAKLDQAKIFTPNFTTKSSGSGLGLMMTKRIVELEKGEIWFTSTVDVGSSFYIRLPKYEYAMDDAIANREFT